MLTLFSLLIILFLISFLLIYKRKVIFKLSKNVIKQSKINHYQSDLNSKLNFSTQIYPVDNNIYLTKVEKISLRIEMRNLFNGNKTDKVNALKIAEKLGDQSTLPILKIGLKDSDPDIVKISAKLINKFK